MSAPSRMRPSRLSGRSTIGPRLLFAATLLWGITLALGLVLLFGAASLAFAPPVSAASELQSQTITPSFPNGEPTGPKISAKAAILIDMDSGRVLYSHAANTRLPMASTTKIMTGILAIESLGLDDKVTISAKAASTYGSMLGFKKGEVLPVEELLYALLVPSANDAAIALAEASAGSVPAFVEKMNEKAQDLGLTNTHYVNTNGLNVDKHFSSAKDLATLAAYAMRNEVFRRIVGTRNYTFLRPGENGTTVERKSVNHNLLLMKYGWVTGVKTGSTPYAKFCLVASGTKDGVSLIAVVLGAKDEDTRLKETKALFDYGFALYPLTQLADKGTTALSVEPSDPLGRQVALTPQSSLSVRLFKSDKVTVSTRLDGEISLPVHAGDVLGKTEFMVGGKSIGSVKLVAAESVEKATIRMMLLHWRTWWPPTLPLGDYLLAAASS
jgi:serine-type D-Ala-D-Ala carboxypeptidase (penicillin-binding protein 5/6)